MKVLALIPARGGSKGVPNKNKAQIAGKPLIQYSIEAALESKHISDTWISSDDQDILELGQKYPTISLHRRSSELASDDSPITDTIKAILTLQEKNMLVDAIMILQPTSPIRTGTQIDESIELLSECEEANSLISVCAMDDMHPARMYWNEQSFLKPIMQEHEQTLRQKIPKAYYRNGSIYLVRKQAFVDHHSVMVKPTAGYEMPLEHLLNIDAPRDLLIAETLISAWKKGELI